MTQHEHLPKVVAQWGRRRRTIELTPIAGHEADLTSGQRRNAHELDLTHWFVMEDIQVPPAYLTRALRAAGWEATQIGWTTYVSSTWGARRIMEG